MWGRAHTGMIQCMDRPRNAQEISRPADEDGIDGLSVLASGQQTTSQETNQLREVNTMAASIFVEQETGTYSGRVHPHNGYYAGDFSAPRQDAAPAWRSTIPAFEASGFDAA
jgi:hypothetical protein